MGREKETVKIVLTEAEKRLDQIVLTEAEKGLDLADLLLRAERFLDNLPGDLILTEMRCFLRIAIAARQDADGCRAAMHNSAGVAGMLSFKLSALTDELAFVKGERDKLAAEIEQWEFADPGPIAAALQELSDGFDGDNEPIETDRAIASKRGLAPWQPAIMRLESLIAADYSPDCLLVAREAVLALAHLHDSRNSEEAENAVTEHAKPDDTEDEETYEAGKLYPGTPRHLYETPR